MGIIDRLFRQNKAEDIKARYLSLEGTRFPLYRLEKPFFEECRKSGQAAMVLPFIEYWAVNSRGSQANATGGGTRLLCYKCLINMSMSFQSSYWDEENAPNRCPHCGSKQAILVWDQPKYVNIALQDMEAIRELWQFRCRLWWKENDRSEFQCARCYANVIPRGEGYHEGSKVICEKCAIKATNAEALSKLKESPDYFGISELRRAINFKAGSWQFEQPSLTT